MAVVSSLPKHRPSNLLLVGDFLDKQRLARKDQAKPLTLAGPGNLRRRETSTASTQKGVDSQEFTADASTKEAKITSGDEADAGPGRPTQSRRPEPSRRDGQRPDESKAGAAYHVGNWITMKQLLRTARRMGRFRFVV